MEGRKKGEKDQETESRVMTDKRWLLASIGFRVRLRRSFLFCLRYIDHVLGPSKELLSAEL